MNRLDMVSQSSLEISLHFVRIKCKVMLYKNLSQCRQVNFLHFSDFIFSDITYNLEIERGLN